MKVVVRLYLFLRDVLGSKEVALELSEGSSVSELLQIIREQYGLPDRISTGYGNLILIENDQPTGLIVLVGGRNIKKLQGMATVLEDGSVITLFPPAAGG